MKEKEKAEIKLLSDKLDALNHKDAAILAQGNGELIAKHEEEKEKLVKEIARLKEVQISKLSKQAQELSRLPFSREISKKEQADMGTLKKSVRGLIVVHPMTALGREMGLKVVTGYAKKPF
ncbi:hypothetical protein CYR40_12555 [Chimaeribacter arupi]|uniref:YibL family ribosome-associated protein n=1 Tax=Nissabacter archeti TaxID=1917880 RepID=A0ABS5JD86_9GAMM|nr:MULTISPECIES: YibL family ribosome-associated protein [Yersiniaceae]MBS0967915.1 YibL family ribosome-associated protein [Nissabacter archeti]MDV5142520.1 YibL family ribosome-associated protein [Chimaeribacter arupi]PLR37226.1 hypothetical protein CYR23_05895 [Chimaeribacter arupi]PLR45544.1 hypothetical protein CYR40_12555 [Chimaeribacter arupi]PLR54696.1 hypothetical protein CYR52_01080 [Chimaeribacter arupi]